MACTYVVVDVHARVPMSVRACNFFMLALLVDECDSSISSLLTDA